MPLGKLRHDYSPVPAPTPITRVTTDVDGLSAIPSPAHALQERLASRTSASATSVDKWSPRRSLALIVASSAALWMAILMAGAQASRMIA